MTRATPKQVPIGSTYVFMGQLCQCQGHLTDAHGNFVDNIPGKFFGPAKGKPITIIGPDGTTRVKTFDPPPAILAQSSGKPPEVTQPLPVVKSIPPSAGEMPTKAPRTSRRLREAIAAHERYQEVFGHHRPQVNRRSSSSDLNEGSAIGTGVLWAVIVVLCIVIYGMWTAQERSAAYSAAAKASRGEK
jgi:hypothetical protein